MTAATSVIPSAANAATSASTWSRTVIVGNREPHGLPSRARELGPVEPRHPPRTLVATAHQRLVSIGAPGPAIPPHQPGIRESPVRACSTRTTLSRLGDSSPQRCTAIETSSITSPLSRVSGPMSTTSTSPSAGSAMTDSCERVMSCSLRSRVRGRPGCHQFPPVRRPTAPVRGLRRWRVVLPVSTAGAWSRPGE